MLRTALTLAAFALLGCGGKGEDGQAAAASGGGGSGGAGASTTTGSAGAPACPDPPAGVSENARAAILLQNQERVAMGVPCATMITSINAGALAHCEYYKANTGNCIANPHGEVMGCAKFVAASFAQRMKLAGYTGQPASEVMAFANNGHTAMRLWIDSVWHRTPVLDPWVRDMGYGGIPGCDTVDLGVGTPTPDNVVATYPYDGQTDVPTSFNGLSEGPMPPKPPTGWPSGYPIHIYVKGGSVTEHTLTIDGSTTPIDHLWMGHGDALSMGLLKNAYVMYAHKPLQSKTTYRVHIGGTPARDFKFTTQ
jgi:hypothetical protein